MGVNISVYKVDTNSALEDSEWDWFRYSGDREFASIDNFERVYLSHDGLDLWRPEQISNAVEWVRENIHEENQLRLLEILERMETDPQLWFESSW